MREEVKRKHRWEVGHSFKCSFEWMPPMAISPLLNEDTGQDKQWLAWPTVDASPGLFSTWHRSRGFQRKYKAAKWKEQFHLYAYHPPVSHRLLHGKLSENFRHSASSCHPGSVPANGLRLGDGKPSVGGQFEHLTYAYSTIRETLHQTELTTPLAPSCQGPRLW